MQVELRIPATSANLGSGFDSLGLALGLYNRVLLEPWDRVEVVSLDGVPVPAGEDNLIYQTAKHLFDVCGRPLGGLRIRQENAIPMARGLGSSSACIVAGLLGANRLMGEPLARGDIVDMAAALEGHPDNSTPAILGGQVTAAVENGHVYYCRQEVRDDLLFAAVIPDFELRTSAARAALPGEVSRSDGVFNLSRAALMAMSLAQGRYENLRVAAQDRFHQPYRLELIPGARAVMDCALELGAYCAYISGSGSTLMAVAAADNAGFARRLRGWLDSHGCGGWKLLPLGADNAGARLTAAESTAGPDPGGAGPAGGGAHTIAKEGEA